MRNERLLQVASVLAIIALGLVIWGTLAATVGPVMVSMTLGQLLGAASFAIYIVVLVRDIGLRGVLHRDNHGPKDAP